MMSELEKKIIELFKPPFKYDNHGYYIADVEGKKVLDIRGWGVIQKEKNADLLQDTLGEMIAKSLNEMYHKKKETHNYYFPELKLPISKQEALDFDRKKYTEDYVIGLCNKLIPKINGIITINYDEIVENSKSQYPFEVFRWDALDDEFLNCKKILREKAISELTKIYLKEGIQINILCMPISDNGCYFRRISFRFI